MAILGLSPRSIRGVILPLNISNFLQGFWKELAILGSVRAVLGLVGWFFLGGYQGKVSFDPSKSESSPRKWMSSGCLKVLVWTPKVNLDVSLKKVCEVLLSRGIA